MIRQNIGTSLGIKTLLAIGMPFGLVNVIVAVVVGDMVMSISVGANAMRLSNGRLGRIKRQRSKDGLSYQETRLVHELDVELPGEVNSKTTDDGPTTDGVVGE
ncbi:ATPase P [Haladaptatus paucihalophilus]|uniref:ATPase P n=1 Tax=Haladaptatus paucihalophilus TaxID=367189 RepID=UPI0034A20B66